MPRTDWLIVASEKLEERHGRPKRADPARAQNSAMDEGEATGITIPAGPISIDSFSSRDTGEEERINKESPGSISFTVEESSEKSEGASADYLDDAQEWYGSTLAIGLDKTEPTSDIESGGSSAQRERRVNSRPTRNPHN